MDQARAGFSGSCSDPTARPRPMLAQSLRRSIRQAVPRGRSGRTIPMRYCSHAIDAGRGFQYLIGEITAHQEFVNFAEIGEIVFHGNLQKIPSPLIWYIREGFGAVPCVTLRDIPILAGANRTRRSTLCRADAVVATERHRRMGCGAGNSGAGRIVLSAGSNGLRKRPAGRGEDKNPSRRCPKKRGRLRRRWIGKNPLGRTLGGICAPHRRSAQMRGRRPKRRRQSS